MANRPGAVKGSIAMLKRQVELAREQRDAALHDASTEKHHYLSFVRACEPADWTCPRCNDKADVPGSCRECLIDDNRFVERVPGSDIIVLELHAALTAGLDMLDEYVRQTMVANPEWRSGYLAMRDARMKHLARAKDLWERAFGRQVALNLEQAGGSDAVAPPRKP